MIKNRIFLGFTLLIFLVFSFVVAEERFYVSTEEVFPGQVRIAKQVIEDKIVRSIKQGMVVWDEEQGEWSLAHGGGKSFFSLAEAFPVVMTDSGYILVDGHHSYSVNVAFGGTLIPVKVIADFSDLSEEEFMKVGTEKGLLYPFDRYGNVSVLPKDFLGLKDDANRYFARLCKASFSPSGEFVKGVEYPIWIKIGKDIPFIEMKIAEALWNAGLVYREDSDDTFYEAAREVIREANIEGLRVVPERIHVSELAFQKFRVCCADDGA